MMTNQRSATISEEGFQEGSNNNIFNNQHGTSTSQVPLAAPFQQDLVLGAFVT
jgi:hypothetical protein